MSEFNELVQFDQAYTPASARKPGLEILADGEYDFEIVGSELARTPNTNELLLKMYLKVLSMGAIVENTYFFRVQQNADILGSDLITLGIDSDKWKPPHRPFSKELPLALPKLVGKRFRGNKITKANPSDSSKPYHNLFINNVIGAGSVTGMRTASGPAPKPAANPKPAEPVIGYGSNPDDPIPF